MVTIFETLLCSFIHSLGFCSVSRNHILWEKLSFLCAVGRLLREEKKADLKQIL